MMSRKAFTLVEILIVVTILGILAAIVLPSFSGATAVARASMLGDDLRVLRMQVSVYKAQHHGAAPGYPLGDDTATPTSDAFVAQMTKASDAGGTTGEIGTAGLIYGPYFREMPTNPLNNKNTVLVVEDAGTIPDASDSVGWIYQPSTMTVRADATGSDEHGKNFYDY